MLEMEDDDQVSDWTKGLPSNEELTPLSHSLISQVLASAFRIKHEEPMTADDVRRESRATLRNIFNQKSTPAFDVSGAFPAFQEEEEAGGFGYGMDGRHVEEEFRGERRVEEDFRGIRADEEFREEFRGNQREEERRDGRPHAVDDRMDHRGASRPEAPRLPSAASGTDTSRGNAGVGGPGAQPLQGSAAGREYLSTPTNPGGDSTALEQRAKRPGSSTSPFLMNALPYGPYESSRAEAGGKDDDDDESGRAGAAADLELEDANSAGGPASSNEDPNAKRARLVWTPQLHKRFVEAVGHLGIKSAVPKTIMQLMNVEGLTRENVASHLQKYRLYLKRMQGLSGDDGPSPSDHLFASMPLPPGMSPHFIPSRDDGGGGGGGGGPFQKPILPMGYPGLVRPGSFVGGYEPMAYGPRAGGCMQQQTPIPDPRMPVNVAENEGRSHASRIQHGNHRSQSHQNQQPSSSSQCALPLFPTNGNRR